MKIGAAILTEDKELLLQQVDMSRKADFIQIDVLDGKFVGGKKTVWLEDLKKAINRARRPVELHLMVQDIDNYIDDFLKLDAYTYIFHYEATQNHSVIIQKIRAAKKKVGIALKLTTSATVLRKIVNDLDLVLVYCTEKIGEQGPPFSITSVRNIHIIREYSKKINIEVDGGIKPHTARLAKLAGATSAVSGSFLFNNNFSEDALKQLRDA
jgi:ribulose-phosphate 3-epimerase